MPQYVFYMFDMIYLSPIYAPAAITFDLITLIILSKLRGETLKIDEISEKQASCLRYSIFHVLSGNPGCDSK